MTSRYWLPCGSCGRRVMVEPRQAGQVVRCECGATMETPTMLQMTALERVEAESGSSPVRGDWGGREGLLLVGVVILLTAIGLGVNVAWRRPPAPDRGLPTADFLRKQVQDLSPIGSMNTWREWRAAGLRRAEPPDDSEYRAELRAWRLWMGLDVAVAFVGLGLVVGPLVSRRIESRRSLRAEQEGQGGS